MVFPPFHHFLPGSPLQGTAQGPQGAPQGDAVRRRHRGGTPGISMGFSHGETSVYVTYSDGSWNMGKYMNMVCGYMDNLWIIYGYGLWYSYPSEKYERQFR